MGQPVPASVHHSAARVLQAAVRGMLVRRCLAAARQAVALQVQQRLLH